mmetsp:Transcript_68512/g.198770  ORF Transcript_68512/g.198770 Transcript_68512/m.198770 type:complete len:204 (-) Transcript_68512:1069-1680(-)
MPGSAVTYGSKVCPMILPIAAPPSKDGTNSPLGTLKPYVRQVAVMCMQKNMISMPMSKSSSRGECNKLLKDAVPVDQNSFSVPLRSWIDTGLPCWLMGTQKKTDDSRNVTNNTSRNLKKSFLPTMTLPFLPNFGACIHFFRCCVSFLLQKQNSAPHRPPSTPIMINIGNSHTVYSILSNRSKNTGTTVPMLPACMRTKMLELE